MIFNVKRGTKALFFALVFSFFVFCMPAFIHSPSLMDAAVVYGGEWIQDASGWRYRLSDATFVKSAWRWIDGNEDGMEECYYFDENGYCLLNTITPDGCRVNRNGAWMVDYVICQRRSIPDKLYLYSGNYNKVYVEDLVGYGVDFDGIIRINGNSVQAITRGQILNVVFNGDGIKDDLSGNVYWMGEAEGKNVILTVGWRENSAGWVLNLLQKTPDSQHLYLYSLALTP